MCKYIGHIYMYCNRLIDLSIEFYLKLKAPWLHVGPFIPRPTESTDIASLPSFIHSLTLILSILLVFLVLVLFLLHMTLSN